MSLAGVGASAPTLVTPDLRHVLEAEGQGEGDLDQHEAREEVAAGTESALMRSSL